MPKVFFIGDVALAEYYQADYFPKIKEQVFVHTLPSQVDGSIANTACAFAALKHEPYFLTALNSGAVTQTLIQKLNGAGINTDYMVYNNQISDAKYIIILAEDEHMVFIPTLSLQKIEVDEETVRALCESDFIFTNFCELRPLCCGNQTVFRVLQRIKNGKTQIW
ncbi:MAG: carbohydrate kinase family protein [Clostridiaceae bacterium]|nr:carbohydrate kinase family protein [Clostridiaceae bacterium]